MDYRKYSVRVIGLLLAMLMIVGSIRPVAAAEKCLIKLTESKFQTLRIEDGVPEEVVDKLQQLKNVAFCNIDDFVDAVKEKISDDDYEEYGKTILKRAREIELNKELFTLLTDDDKENIITELNLGIPLERFTGINFLGEVVARPVRLTGQPTTVCVEEGPSGEFMDYVDVGCDEPLLIQKLYAENCGTYDDMVHLTVTKSKDASHETHYEWLWSGDLTVNFEYTFGFGGTVGTSFSYGWQYAEGSSDTFTTSTSWDQSVDVVVPPRQRLEVDFVAFKKKVSQDFEQEFIAMGTAKPVIRSEDPIIVKLFSREEDEQGEAKQQEYRYDDGENVIDLTPEMFRNKLNMIELVSGKNVRIELYGSDDNQVLWDNQRELPLTIYLLQDVIPTNARPRMVAYWRKDAPAKIYGLTLDLPWGYTTYPLSNYFKDLASMRVIDLNQPYVCIARRDITVPYYTMGKYQWVRCFNIGQDVADLGAFNYKHRVNDSVYFDEIEVHGVKAILYSDENYEGTSKTFTESRKLGTLDHFASIRIGAADTEDVFSVQDYLSPEQRTITIQGTYNKVDYAEGHFVRNTSTRMEYAQCCTERGFSGTESIDCMEENWAKTMDSFVVYVKTREENGGQGIIYQNGIRCGEECTIAVPLPDLPVLWKLEAKPLADSEFIGWQSETGQVLEGKHKPLPGDTIYAVFGPAATPTPTP